MYLPRYRIHILGFIGIGILLTKCYTVHRIPFNLYVRLHFPSQCVHCYAGSIRKVMYVNYANTTFIILIRFAVCLNKRTRQILYIRRFRLFLLAVWNPQYIAWWSSSISPALFSASEMTYIVSSGALNSTHSPHLPCFLTATTIKVIETSLHTSASKCCQAIIVHYRL